MSKEDTPLAQRQSGPRVIADSILPPGITVTMRRKKRKGKSSSSSSSLLRTKRKPRRPLAGNMARVPSNITPGFAGKRTDSAVSQARANRGMEDSESSIDMDRPEKPQGSDDDVIITRILRSDSMGQRTGTSGISRGKQMDVRTEAQRELDIADPTVPPRRPNKKAIGAERMARARYETMQIAEIAEDVETHIDRIAKVAQNSKNL